MNVFVVTRIITRHIFSQLVMLYLVSSHQFPEQSTTPNETQWNVDLCGSIIAARSV